MSGPHGTRESVGDYSGPIAKALDLTQTERGKRGGKAGSALRQCVTEVAGGSGGG